MRILVVTDWYPARVGDPAGSFVRAQALAVSARHEVAVLHLADPVADAGRARLRIEVEQDGPLLTLRLRRGRGLPVTAGNLAALPAALRLLRGSGFVPEVLHAHEVGAGFASAVVSAVTQRPFVVSVHQATFALGEVDRVSGRLARWTFARADAVCPPSVSLRERMQTGGWPGRLRVVPNAIDTARFAPPPMPAVADGSPPRIVAVAALDPVKGVEELIEACGLLARRGAAFRLDLVGDGTLRATLEARVRELELTERVTFHGTLPPDAVAAHMHAASFAVVPSRWETFSVVLSEAMACGLPVVATTVGALPERVDEDSGLLVPPRDPQALADGLATMLARYATYARTAIAARTRTHFSPEAVAAAWDAVYTEAVERRRAARRSGR